MEAYSQSGRKISGGGPMITTDEIKKKSRDNGIPTTTIERDYVQNIFLYSLYSRTDSLIFKGGTAIRKAYIGDYRFSDSEQ